MTRLSDDASMAVICTRCESLGMSLEHALRLARAPLNVSADMLLFEPDERGPDDRLKLQFEAVIEAIRDLMAPPAPAHKRPIGFVTPDNTSAKPKAVKVKR